MVLANIVEKILAGNNLDHGEATWVMEQTMSGSLTPAQIASWLIALRSKKDTAEEISAFAGVMRKNAVPVNGVDQAVMDTCGTGGDRSGLINVSTLSALVLACRGVKIAKHGNRSVSSKSGAADLMEKMGYPLDEGPDAVVKRINEKNFGFFFAPAFHPAMKFAGPVRKEIGVRTIFNILGPLSNPAHAPIHLLGVFEKGYLNTLAEALHKLGAKTIMVVHSEDGLDEFSPLAINHYCLYHNGKQEQGTWDPKELSLCVKSLSELVINSPEEAFQRAKDILEGKDALGAEMVALNTTAAEYLWKLYHNETQESLSEFMKETFPEIKKMILDGKCNYKSVI